MHYTKKNKQKVGLSASGLKRAFADSFLYLVC